MNIDPMAWMEHLAAHAVYETLLYCTLLLVAAWLGNWLVKRVLLRGLRRILRRFSPGPGDEYDIVRRLANIAPALVISIGVVLVPGLPETAAIVVRNVATGFIVLTVAMALGATLNMVDALYQKRPDANQRPIKGYLGVVKIVVYVVAALLIVAVLIDRSPLILLSGVGAMAAVLILVFQDTLLSLVASIQITSNDLVRIGDWIQMPHLNADGDVIDISLHTIKVQNFDKTITTIPTRRLISDSFKNFRGMKEAGGRRIKRSIYIDQQSIRFLTEDECEDLRRLSLLEGYLNNKREELGRWNAQLSKQGQENVNFRRITNIGMLRVYIVEYLRSLDEINQNLKLMSRQLEPSSDGLPLQVYCFTHTTDWVEHEGVQSDIFDHLLAIIPEFDLRIFQRPSGLDIARSIEHGTPRPAADAGYD